MCARYYSHAAHMHVHMPARIRHAHACTHAYAHARRPRPYHRAPSFAPPSPTSPHCAHLRACVRVCVRSWRTQMCFAGVPPGRCCDSAARWWLHTCLRARACSHVCTRACMRVCTHGRTPTTEAASASPTPQVTTAHTHTTHARVRAHARMRTRRSRHPRWSLSRWSRARRRPAVRRTTAPPRSTRAPHRRRSGLGVAAFAAWNR